MESFINGDFLDGGVFNGEFYKKRLFLMESFINGDFFNGDFYKKRVFKWRGF